MNEQNQQKSIFKCILCSESLECPVTIPCGNTVCKSHLNDFIGQKTFECQCCKQEHSVHKEGFVMNKFIQDQLKMQLNLNPVLDGYKNGIEQVYINVERYIYNYYEDIKRHINLEGQLLKEEIDRYFDKMIQLINVTQNSNIYLPKDENKLRTNIKKDMNKLIRNFDTFEIDEKNIHDVQYIFENVIGIITDNVSILILGI